MLWMQNEQLLHDVDPCTLLVGQDDSHGARLVLSALDLMEGCDEHTDNQVCVPHSAPWHHPLRGGAERTCAQGQGAASRKERGVGAGWLKCRPTRAGEVELARWSLRAAQECS